MMLQPQPPTCWIVAGPNGAGLSPLAPERELLAASRIFLREIEDAIEDGEDFAFETTLSGREYLSLVKRLLSNSWRVELVCLALPSVEMSRLRVAERVSHGGHNIPLKDIQRRFPRSLNNLLTPYAPSVSRARCFMNAGGTPEMVFKQIGSQRHILDDPHYNSLVKEARP